jgi:hypothetical protein
MFRLIMVKANSSYQPVIRLFTGLTTYLETGIYSTVTIHFNRPEKPLFY